MSHKAWDMWPTFIEDTHLSVAHSITCHDYSFIREVEKSRYNQTPKTKFTCTVKLRKDFPAVQSCEEEEP